LSDKEMTKIKVVELLCSRPFQRKSFNVSK
jgi:hypothetical protein